MNEGPHYRFQDIEFWCESGLIFIEDHRSGDVKIDTCKTFLTRAVALNESAKRCKYPDEHKELVDCVCAMAECYKLCKASGDISDPKIMLQKYKERKKSVLLSDTRDAVIRPHKHIITGIF